MNNELKLIVIGQFKVLLSNTGFLNIVDDDNSQTVCKVWIENPDVPNIVIDTITSNIRSYLRVHKTRIVDIVKKENKP